MQTSDMSRITNSHESVVQKFEYRQSSSCASPVPARRGTTSHDLNGRGITVTHNDPSLHCGSLGGAAVNPALPPSDGWES